MSIVLVTVLFYDDEEVKKKLILYDIKMLSCHW
jgi:hypothetical protein